VTTHKINKVAIIKKYSGFNLVTSVNYYLPGTTCTSGRDLRKTISILFIVIRKAVSIKNRPFFFGLAEEI
jgi:hypothetical protein